MTAALAPARGGVAPRPTSPAGLTAFFARQDHVFLAFSGGVGSVVLADLCRPWADKVTLLHVSTGMSFPHMLEFVESYKDTFALEVIETDAYGSWRSDGIPVSVLTDAHASGQHQPRMRSSQICCQAHRVAPLFKRLEGAEGTVGFLSAVRADDQSMIMGGVRAALPKNVEAMMPLWDWSEADVLDHARRGGLRLPEQYEFGAIDSLPCAWCGARMTPETVKYLRMRHPEAAHNAHKTAAMAGIAAARAACQIGDTWGSIIPDPHDGVRPAGEPVN